MIQKIIGIVLIVVVLGALLPVLWPMIEDTGTDIAAMEGGTATDFIQAMWPILLIVIGVGVGAGLIFFALRNLGVFGGSSNGGRGGGRRR